MSGYDAWKLQSPEDEAEENERRWRDPRRDFFDEVDEAVPEIQGGGR